MSADAQGPTGQQMGGTGEGQPSEEELRAAYEAELSRITAVDLMAQTAVSLLNVGARKLSGAGEAQPAGAGSAPAPDLEQARDAIDGARALLEILERRIPQELAPLRDALSRLQMAYARDMQAAPVQPGAAGTPTESPAPAGAQAPAAQPGAAEPAGGEQPGGPGPAEASGRLWVPGR